MPVTAPPTRSTIPHFYKYSNAQHLEWLESIILRHELYFPTPSQLNDPADGKPKLAKSSLDQIVKFLLEKYVNSNPGLPVQAYEKAAREIAFNAPRFGTDALLREIAKTLKLELENIRIYSLSKRHDNMSLWAKYAGDHTGYCLEFANDGLFACAYEVIYDETVTVDVTDPAQVNAHFFFYKSSDWRNEEEVRIVAPRSCQAVIQFEPRLLTRVILGKKMSEPHRRKIRDWAQRRCPELAVVSAEFDELQQRLIIKQA